MRYVLTLDIVGTGALIEARAWAVCTPMSIALKGWPS